MHHLATIIATAVISAVCSGIAAWYGGVLGVRREAEKLIQARAFEGRLKWYEQTMRALQHYQREHQQFMHAAAQPEKPAIEQHYETIMGCFTEVTAAFQEGPLYGRESTLTAILDFLIVMNKQLSSNDFGAASEKIEIAVSRATVAIAREARGHMGLEPLPERILKSPDV